MENQNPYKRTTIKAKLEEALPTFVCYGSVIFLVLTLFFYLGVPLIITWRVELETQIKRGNPTWDKWVDADIPRFFVFRVFNITNPDAIFKGEKFKLQELGPYVYEEERVKTIVATDEEEDTLTYYDTFTYHFRPDLSTGDEYDRINAINIAYTSMVTMLEEYLPFLNNVLTRMMEEEFEESLVLNNVTVRGFLFTGVELNPLYLTLAAFSPPGPSYAIRGNTFAVLNGRNGSREGKMKMKSGIRDSSLFGQLLSFKGTPELDYWTDPSIPSNQNYCNKLNGSDGSLYPPFLTKQRTIQFFHPLVCRSYTYHYNREVEYRGISGYEFTDPRDLFASPSKNPDNWCFCPERGAGLNETCLDGAQRIFTCVRGLPSLMSKPHFMDGHQALIDGVEGLSPNRELHESVVQLEPVQLSTEIQPVRGISSLENLPHVIVPAFWLEQQAYIHQEFIDFLNHVLVLPLRIVFLLKCTLLGTLGLGNLLGIIYLIVRNLKRSKVKAVTILTKPLNQRNSIIGN